jgi:hypothetical protein
MDESYLCQCQRVLVLVVCFHMQEYVHTKHL